MGVLENLCLNEYLAKLGISPSIARAYFQLFFNRVPKYAFGHETGRQGRYKRKNTSKIDISATRIQWKMPRTRIPPKIWKT